MAASGEGAVAVEAEGLEGEGRGLLVVLLEGLRVEEGRLGHNLEESRLCWN